MRIRCFQWRTLYRKGRLGGTPMTPVKLLPVSAAEQVEVPAEAEEQAVPAVAGTIRIKLAGQCQGQSKTKARPVGQSKSRPLARWQGAAARLTHLRRSNKDAALKAQSKSVHGAGMIG